ncbi:Ger(x)C family spore germination protein [Ornithinibacillus sp. 179-J 7C1 HS]|uniref:Ger(x)C family spore germination protein n=1 Tax=Ornithinibacillus sp. 179-J 7C1 HS TaxID=3142384 RepID=UPI00399F693D
MVNRFIKLLCIGGMLVVVMGCWDEKNIGEVNYPVTLAIDYKDNRYIVYVQLLDFSNVAKQEVKTSQPSPLFIGRGEGETFNIAIDEIYRTSQLSIDWSHIGAIIYTESVLERGIEEVELSLSKNGEFRYTPWVFGTKESIEDILSTSGFFQLPPVYTILYRPLDLFKSYSYIEPVRLHKFISIYSEPGGTGLIPSLQVNTSSWRQATEETLEKNVLEINGVHAVSEGKYKGWLSFDDVVGLRWTQNNTERSTIDIKDEESIVGTVEVEQLLTNTSVEINGKNIRVDITVQASGMVKGLEENLNPEEVMELVSKQMENEIETTYQIGIDHSIDIYNIRNKVFHKRVTPNKLGEYSFTKDSLHVNVTFLLKSMGVKK